MITRILAVLAAVLILSEPVTARENKLESWYIHCGLGLSANDYQFEDVDELHPLASLVLLFASASTGGLGVYWPYRDKTIIGTAADIIGGEDFTQSLTSISAMRFLTHEIGQGLFVRADLGLAWHEAPGESFGGENEYGMGFLLAGGYGIPITSGTRILLSAHYARRQLESFKVSSLGLTLNGMF